MDDLVALLATVRRIDWRFLLPDPALGRVAYLAPHEPEVVAALQAVTPTVDLLGSPAQGDGAYDVAVVTDRRGAAAAGARGLLRSGGWVCAEVRGARARGCARALRESGYRSVAAFWLWPHASACREIVPMSSRALREAIGRRDPGGRVRPRVRLGQMLAATPLVALAVRHAAVVGSVP